MASISSGLASLLGEHSPLYSEALLASLAPAELRVFAGAAPASADDAETGSPAAVFSLDLSVHPSYGSTDGTCALIPEPVEAVIAAAVDMATAHVRVVRTGDDGTQSATAVRVQADAAALFTRPSHGGASAISVGEVLRLNGSGVLAVVRTGDAPSGGGESSGYGANYGAAYG